MLELHVMISQWREPLENLGLIAKWVPGLQDQANRLRSDMMMLMTSIETTIVDGFGIPFDVVMKMLEEIDPTGVPTGEEQE
jgi:hypothetical protein